LVAGNRDQLNLREGKRDRREAADEIKVVASGFTQFNALLHAAA
jgi:hypothetical protein